MAKVVSATNKNRVLFEGTEKEARAFVEMNFPRHHVDPASTVEKPEPDVVLYNDTGTREMYLGPEEDKPWVSMGGKTS